MQYLVALFTIVAVACGPSSKEVGAAKTARYQGDKLTMFSAVKATVESKYKLAKSDETTLGMQTQPRWFSPEGLAASATSDDARDLPDKSMNIALVVTMLPDGDAWIVKVSPLMLRKNSGMPKPDPVKDGDPSVPGWVDSRVDQLALDIHTALAKYEVPTGGPKVVPPGPAPDQATGSAAPAAAPAEGAAAGSAAGSAAP
jgi:hypothetical protein